MSFTHTPLEEVYLRKLKKWFPKLVYSQEYNPGKYVAPEKFSTIAKDIFDLKVFPDDVWVVSYPRTGSTWCQEIVWLLMNKFDYGTATNLVQARRAPIMEYYAYSIEQSQDPTTDLEKVRKLSRPRCIKSHCSYELLPKQVKTTKPKILYTIRNPKDVYCSYFSFMKTFHFINATFDEAADLFCKGKLPIGCYFNHSFPFWKRRYERNMLVLKYEDMLKDTRQTIVDIAKFLEKPVTNEQIDKLHNFVLFDNLKKSPGFNLEDFHNFDKRGVEPFVRKGKVGDWKTRMSPRINEMFDEWIEKKTGGTDMEFDYE